MCAYYIIYYISFFVYNEGSSKTHQASLTLKGGYTSHLGLLPSGKKKKPLLSIVFTTPSVPLVGDRNLREEEETAPPCRSEPFHSMVGGPSEVYASSGSAVFCAG